MASNVELQKSLHPRIWRDKALKIDYRTSSKENNRMVDAKRVGRRRSRNIGFKE